MASTMRGFASRESSINSGRPESMAALRSAATWVVFHGEIREWDVRSAMPHTRAPSVMVKVLPRDVLHARSIPNDSALRMRKSGGARDAAMVIRGMGYGASSSIADSQLVIFPDDWNDCAIWALPASSGWKMVLMVWLVGGVLGWLSVNSCAPHINPELSGSHPS